MDGSKLIVLGAIVLAIGIMIPLISYTFFMIPTNTQSKTSQPAIIYSTTETPLSKTLEKTEKELKIRNIASFNTYSELFEYINTLYREYVEESRTIFNYPSLFPLIAELKGGYAAVTPTMTTAGYGVKEAGETRYSETNVQVQGIDEPDIVKTNGEYIAVAWKNKLYIVDPGTSKILWKKAFNATITSVYLLQEYLVVITRNENNAPIEIRLPGENLEITIPKYTANTTIYVYEKTNNGYREAYNIDITGNPVSSRLLNNTLYLITIQSLKPNNPVVPIVDKKPLPPSDIYVIEDNPTTYTNILAINIESGKYSTYSFIAGPYSRIYMSHKYLIIASYTPWYQRVIDIKVFKTITKYLPSSIGKEINEYLDIGKYGEAMKTLYGYLEKLTIEEIKDLFKQINEELSKIEYINTDNTTFYVFRINSLSLVYKGKLVTEGNIRDQFCMEVYKEKYFIAATTVEHFKLSLSYWIVNPQTITITGNKEITVIENGEIKKYEITITEAKNPGYTNSWNYPVYVYPSISLRSVDNQLTIFNLESMKKISNITNIAPGERIYAARIINNYFFIVTYRRVDPIFAINITDPYHPEIIGYLKIPGYNEYLHPLSNDRLLGIGVENGDLIISLYDISNPRNIKELSKIRIDDSTSLVLYNYHAFTIDYDKQLIFIPIRSYRIFLGYQTSNWDLGSVGILVIKYSDNKVETVTILQHPGASRTIYIGEKVYTISPTSIKVFDENTFEEITEIPLQ